LNGDKDPGNRTQETNLGDLICDAMVWGAKENGETVDAAITNGGGIRATIEAGDITKKDVNTVLPFGNTLSIVKVTGTELLEALEASTYCTPTAIGGFPQVSGIEFTVDTEQEFDEGDLYPGSTYHKPASVKRVTIQTVGGKEFDPEATYAIATNDFLAAGGDTYYAFSASSVNYDLGLPLDEVLMDYIKEELKGTVTAEAYGEPAGSITVKLPAEPEPEPEPEPTPEPEPEPQPEPQPEGTYTVVRGDNLSKIAKAQYGDSSKWTVIYEANKNIIKNPNQIWPGQTLVLPAA
ncbi:MAG: LysM peptidoglycan-binding domain-containing protein, partial [Oscillospiraceae bacterium]|nr:LysM peptidoglycan-binding domain-containing protein [Oscillospiraceae bacterium]